MTRLDVYEAMDRIGKKDVLVVDARDIEMRVMVLTEPPPP